jgi:hypothetical protein
MNIRATFCSITGTPAAPVSRTRDTKPISQATTVFCFLLSVVGLYGQNAITDWETLIQPAVVATAPGPPNNAIILYATISLAMYDATVAVGGGYQPFFAKIPAEPGADVRAAIAAAAYQTALARLAASQKPYLDTAYMTYLSGIPAGSSRDAGVKVGEQAAAAVIASRANDGFNVYPPYVCSSVPPPAGEFEPNGGCGTLPIGTNVSQMMPFALKDRTQFQPNGPPPFRSNVYTRDIEETRDFGRSDSSFRTAEQTDIAYFWQFVATHTNLINLVISQGLNVVDSARFFGMVYTSMADGAIAGFATKYHYRFWRPRTAIPRAAEDGNPDTTPDATWTPLISVNHPEYPSAHAFVSTAMADAIAKILGTSKVTWTVTSGPNPLLVKTKRTYYDLNDMLDEIYSARVWAGLHWRNSSFEGAALGRKVADYIEAHFFRRLDPNMQ